MRSFVSGRTIATSFGWFFASLLAFSTLSQPGATQDEWQHLASIWCGRGERAPYCTEIREIDGVRSATVNFGVLSCNPAPDVPLSCPANEGASSRQQTFSQGTSWIFYFVMSWLVSPSVELSVFLMRIVNAILITVVLGLLIWLLPRRHQFVSLLTTLATLNVSGYFLFASLNPTSWMILGGGLGWLAFHAASAQWELSKRHRSALVAVGTLLIVMSLSVGNLALYPLIVAGVFLLVDWAASHGFTLRLLAPTLSLLAVILAVTVLSMIYQVPPDEVLLTIPKVLQGFATVPSSSQIRLSVMSFILALLLLAVLFILTDNRASHRQLLGAVSAIGVSSLAVAHHSPGSQLAFRSMVDEIGTLRIDARLSVPLLMVATSWWFLHGPQDMQHNIRKHLRLIFGVILVVFALTAFGIVERYVDRQTFGLRMVPDGPSQWWWPGLPLPPSVMMVMSVAFLWKFFSGIRDVFEGSISKETLP